MDAKDSPAMPTPGPVPGPPRHRVRTMAATLALLMALAGAGWWWSGSEGSLASGLKLVQAMLPAGMALHTTEVQGSLRHGGLVGHAHRDAG